MRAFEAFFNMIDREFWGMSLKERTDSAKHDLARAKRVANGLKR